MTIFDLDKKISHKLLKEGYAEKVGHDLILTSEGLELFRSLERVFHLHRREAPFGLRVEHLTYLLNPAHAEFAEIISRLLGVDWFAKPRRKKTSLDSLLVSVGDLPLFYAVEPEQFLALRTFVKCFSMAQFDPSNFLVALDASEATKRRIHAAYLRFKESIANDDFTFALRKLSSGNTALDGMEPNHEK